MAFDNNQLGELLDFLVKAFTRLRNEVKGEGPALIDHALGALKQVGEREMPIHDWQAFVSMLVRSYAHAHQLSVSATFFDPRTHWRPEGHAEAPHRATLERNEKALSSQGRLLDAPQDVVTAAVALFDGFAGNTSSRAKLAPAYATWLEFMRKTYPTIMQAGGTQILEGMRKKNVGTKELHVALGSVVTI